MAAKSHIEKFWTAITRAGAHASTGDGDSMNAYIKEAKVHHKNHIKEHETTHGRESAAQVHKHLNSIYDAVKDQWEGKDVKKSLSKSGFGSNPSNTGASPYRKEFNSTGKQGDMSLGKPGQDKRYSYKHFSELTPDQQVAAQHKFQGAKDIELHHYPLNDDGSVAHAARWKDPNPTPTNIGTSLDEKHISASSGNAPQANKGFTKEPSKTVPSPGEILPHHKRESSVRISSDGHEHHGKLGIVQAPNMYYPGKVHVKVTKKGGGFESIFVEPHEAVPSKMNKSETDNVIALSKAVLEKLKKRG